MLKKLWIISLSVILLSACSLSKVPSGFSEEQLEKRTKASIEALHQDNISFVYDQFREDVKELITEEALADVLQDKYARVGAFERFDVIAYNKTTDPSTKDVYAVVILSVLHKEGKATYTISYDTSYKIVGFYIQ
jgi:hypothetical protein